MSLDNKVESHDSWWPDIKLFAACTAIAGGIYAATFLSDKSAEQNQSNTRAAGNIQYEEREVLHSSYCGGFEGNQISRNTKRI